MGATVDIKRIMRLSAMALAAMAILGTNSDVSNAGVLVLQPDSTAGKDTYFGTGSVGGQEGRPDGVQLRIGGWGDNWTSFIEFDLATVPTDSTVVSANLHLFNQSSTNSNNGKLFRVTEFWNEADPSDTSSPAAVDFGMSYQSVPNTGWWTVDVTDVVNNWHDGTYPNYGFKMLGEFNCCNHVKHFHSSDYLGDPSLRPKLIVDFTEIRQAVPEPGILGLFCLGLVSLGLAARRRKTHQSRLHSLSDAVAVLRSRRFHLWNVSSWSN